MLLNYKTLNYSFALINTLYVGVLSSPLYVFPSIYNRGVADNNLFKLHSLPNKTARIPYVGISVVGPFEGLGCKLSHPMHILIL